MFSFTHEELETYIDNIKPVIVVGLVKSGLLDADDADKWCEEHTVLLRKKSLFRTISDKWKKDEETKGNYVIVVKKNI